MNVFQGLVLLIIFLVTSLIFLIPWKGKYLLVFSSNENDINIPSELQYANKV